MLVGRGQLSHRSLAVLIVAALAAAMSGSSLPALSWGLSAIAEAGPLPRAVNDTGRPSTHADGEMTWFTIEDLPPRETYAALQRIRYLPGAHLAEQPTDGPKLLNILSGDLTIRVPISGVVLSRPSAEGRITSSLKPRVDQIVNPGTIIMIPAGIPVELSNSSDTPVEWIQFQLETPATLCACGQDRSDVEMELLSSQTLPDPFRPPVVVSVTQQTLDPAAEIPAPSSDATQFVGAVGDGATLLHGEDGSARNDGTLPIEVVVVTIASVDRTDPG